jgi:hypothetical protein
MAQCPVCGARAASFFEKANDGTGVCGEPKECKVAYHQSPQTLFNNGFGR